MAAAAKRGVVVTNTPDVLTEEVADTTLGLLLGTVREFYQAEKWLRDGRWAKEGDYRLTPASLRDRSIGIVGLGRIGKAIARRCEAFGLPVSYFGRNQQPDVSQPLLLRPRRHGARRRHADRHHARAARRRRSSSTPPCCEALGPRGILINMARGSVVDEAALIAALKNRTILAAGLDVYVGEPKINPAFLDARQRHAAAARRLGVGAHARRHGPAGGRQPRRLRRAQAAQDAGAGDAVQGLVSALMTGRSCHGTSR